MPSIAEQFQPISRGGIVYDPARLRNPQAELFTREYWAQRDALVEFTGGRGSVCALRTDSQEWILRHYRRGGFVARISKDRYFWTGIDTTRSVREWRLLAQLHDRGLPVPAPVAARYVRDGMFYRADLITVRLADARTLTEVIREGALDRAMWRHIGATVGRFHAAGAHHVDLNANNIMLAGDAVYLIDFDRGRLRERGAWEAEVIARLRRSLDKLKARDPQLHFGESDWQALIDGTKQ
jgi:3-deoxy-D-manno-octulosonic acid kinase